MWGVGVGVGVGGRCGGVVVVQSVPCVWCEKMREKVRLGIAYVSVTSAYGSPSFHAGWT